MTAVRYGRLAGEGLARFQELRTVLEAVRLRGQPKAQAPTAATDGGEDAAEAPPPLSPQAVHADVFRALTDLGAGGDHGRGAPAADRVDVAYVLTCFADEALMHRIPWPGAETWIDHLLERALYGTTVAGERVFEAAERITSRREAGRQDVAMVIFLALAGGFRGRYRGVDDEGVIDRLKQALFDIASETARPDRADLEAQFADAVAHTITQPRPTPPRGREVWMLVGVIATYVIAGHLIWSGGLAEVSALADAVIRVRDRP